MDIQKLLPMDQQQQLLGLVAVVGGGNIIDVQTGGPEKKDASRSN